MVSGRGECISGLRTYRDECLVFAEVPGALCSVIACLVEFMEVSLKCFDEGGPLVVQFFLGSM